MVGAEILTGIIAEGIGVRHGTCDTGMGASTTTVVCADLAGFGDDYFNTKFYMQIIKNTNSVGNAPESQVRQITNYVSATGTFTVTAFGANVEEGDSIFIIHECIALLGLHADATLAKMVDDSWLAHILAIDGDVSDFNDNTDSLEAISDKHLVPAKDSTADVNMRDVVGKKDDTLKPYYKDDIIAGGTATANGYAEPYVPSNACDNNVDTFWTDINGAPWWWKYDFGVGVTKVVTGYAINAGIYPTNNPGSWTFEGSNDDSDWTVLDTQSEIKTNTFQWMSFDIYSNYTAYRYYRFNITANQSAGSVGFLAEVEFYEAGATTGTVSSHSILKGILAKIPLLDRLINTIGNKDDTANTTVDDTSSIMRYMKGAVNQLASIISSLWKGYTTAGVIVCDTSVGTPDIIVVASYAAANTFGSWTQIDAAASADSCINWIHVALITLTGRLVKAAIEIGTGAGGSEVTKIRIPFSVYANTDIAHDSVGISLTIPIKVASGTRIAARITDNEEAATSYNVGVAYYQGL